jgi:hypothetical protein
VLLEDGVEGAVSDSLEHAVSLVRYLCEADARAAAAAREREAAQEERAALAWYAQQLGWAA